MCLLVQSKIYPNFEFTFVVPALNPWGFVFSKTDQEGNISNYPIQIQIAPLNMSNQNVPFALWRYGYLPVRVSQSVFYEPTQSKTNSESMDHIQKVIIYPEYIFISGQVYLFLVWETAVWVWRISFHCLRFCSEVEI